MKKHIAQPGPSLAELAAKDNLAEWVVALVGGLPGAERAKVQAALAPAQRLHCWVTPDYSRSAA